MTERYYHAEHRDAYARIRSDGLDQWNDLHDRRRSYHDFPSRPFLTWALPARGDGQRALVYGCGTGGAACYLAEAGFVVDAVDLVPDAIEIARARADEHDLDIRFEVADVCRWGAARDRFDVVLDDFCLQSIVTDDDRKRLYAAVRDRLQPSGRFLINTAMYQPDRNYGDDRYDPATGIVWVTAPEQGPDTISIDGLPYQPNRRHFDAAGLRRELTNNGFRVRQQRGGPGGELVCSLA